MNNTSAVFIPLSIGLLCAGIVFAAWMGKPLPLIATPRASLVVLLILGLAMCTGGIGQVGTSGRWTSPFAIAGYLLGAAILVVFAAAFAGWKLPLVRTEMHSLIAVAVLMAVKVAIGSAGYFFGWL